MSLNKEQIQKTKAQQDAEIVQCLKTLSAGGLILYVLCCLPAVKRRLAPGALIALKVLSIALEMDVREVESYISERLKVD